jgi:hypothetical protein
MLKGFNSIGDVQLYWKICEDTYFRSSEKKLIYQDLIEPLAAVYSQIIEYQARVIRHLSKAQLSCAWQNVGQTDDWDSKAKGIEASSQKCSSLIPHFNEEEIRARWDTQLKEMQESRAILDDIRWILKENGKQPQKIYDDEREAALFENLASDYEGDKDFNPPKVEGTCEWFLNDDRFRKWRDSSTSRLLWVSAGPGCGKSVLSRTLIGKFRCTPLIYYSPDHKFSQLKSSTQLAYLKKQHIGMLLTNFVQMGDNYRQILQPRSSATSSSKMDRKAGRI